jgi:DNA polymerase
MTLLDAPARDPSIEIVAHNSAFDRTLIRHCWGIDVPVERWRDTMVRALAHGLPGALGKIGAILGLPDDEQKDKRGKELIQLVLQAAPEEPELRRATRDTHPAEWAEFLEYSRQDIVAMRAIHRRCPSGTTAAPSWRCGTSTSASTTAASPSTSTWRAPRSRRPTARRPG